MPRAEAAAQRAIERELAELRANPSVTVYDDPHDARAALDRLHVNRYINPTRPWNKSWQRVFRRKA